MLEPFAVKALGGACGSHHVHEALLKNTRADAAEHMLFRAAFEHDGIDAFLVEKLCQQETGRAAADDRHLSSHATFSSLGQKIPGRYNFCTLKR